MSNEEGQKEALREHMGVQGIKGAQEILQKHRNKELVKGIMLRIQQRQGTQHH